MTIIRIAYEESPEAVARVEKLLEEVAMRDPNWNGADFQIVRDDYTSMDDDSYDAVALFGQVQAALSGEAEGEA